MHPAPDPGTDWTTPKWTFCRVFVKFAGKKYLKLEFDVIVFQIIGHFDRQNTTNPMNASDFMCNGHFLFYGLLNAKILSKIEMSCLKNDEYQS